MVGWGDVCGWGGHVERDAGDLAGSDLSDGDLRVGMKRSALLHTQVENLESNEYRTTFSTNPPSVSFFFHFVLGLVLARFYNTSRAIVCFAVDACVYIPMFVLYGMVSVRESLCEF